MTFAIAIIAGSFFLYSLAHDIGNRVAWSFSVLLFFVLVTYIGDLGVSYSNSLSFAAFWLRFQWIGIAFTPAAYVHLSHNILTLTGLPSRGRRRWGVRFLYFSAAVFLVLVFSTDLIVRDPLPEPAPHFQIGPVFWLFAVYFVSSVTLSLWFVVRARRRSLVEASRRRMSYLLFTYLAPALAVFPFLLISGSSLTSHAVFYGTLIIVDAVLSVMLTLMAYALAFFGSLQPDRLTKVQMLQFFLRGPVVAIAALAVLIWVPRAGAVLGLPGDDITPLLTVTVILLLQWVITQARPRLERWLVYTGDQHEIRSIQQIEERLLTGADFRQLLDMILAAVCDYLRVETAFVASFTGDSPHLERAVGLSDEFNSHLAKATDIVNGDLPQPDDIKLAGDVFVWNDFWLIPLYFHPANNTDTRLVGLFGVAQPENLPIDAHDDERWQVLMALATRASEALEDRRLQSEVFAALEGLLSEMSTIHRVRAGDMEALTAPIEEVLSSPDYVGKIKDALAHYWGGPKLTDTALMRLSIVQRALKDHDGNSQRAMRAVLQQAIEHLRPEGQRSLTTTEWILYNILEMRFIQGRKVRDVAMRLAMSESDLYRKQRVAIEAVSSIIADMERSTGTDPEEQQPVPVEQK